MPMIIIGLPRQRRVASSNVITPAKAMTISSVVGRPGRVESSL